MLQVQNNKQLLSSYAKKTHDRNVAPYRIPDQESSKINPKWTQEEQLLGVQGNFTHLHLVMSDAGKPDKHFYNGL